MNKKLTDKPFVSTIADGDKVFVNNSGNPQQVEVATLRASMNENDTQVLNDLAFYIDINQPSAKGDTRVDVGGNEHMRQLWENASFPILMDANGNYCELNRNDCRYTAEGEAIVDLTTNELLSKWANCDIMVVIPEYYGRVQEVVVNGQTILRPWFSLVPLPGGYRIPQQVVGKFKGRVLNTQMRSVSSRTPYFDANIDNLWQYAQNKSKNHGLANLDFRNYLLFYMMAKYGWRDSQNCKTSDGTLVWGCGLDGTESTAKEGQTDKWQVQRSILTGSTLSLGMADGNVPVLDANGDTCHSVNVCGFENPWGQFWEAVGGLASVGTDVYCWRGNWMPAGTSLTAETFANVDCVVLRKAADKITSIKIHIIHNQNNQGVYMIPAETGAGITYDDIYRNNTENKLCLFGGASVNDTGCGLAAVSALDTWSYSYGNFSTRLAYYGSIHKVSPTRLAELAV